MDNDGSNLPMTLNEKVVSLPWSSLMQVTDGFKFTNVTVTVSIEVSTPEPLLVSSATVSGNAGLVFGVFNGSLSKNPIWTRCDPIKSVLLHVRTADPTVVH